MITRIAATAFALSLMSAAALAVTVTNKTSKDHKIGVDFGDKESTEVVPAGKSIKVDGCKDQCGFTGPWGYSWMAKSGDTFAFDEKGLKPGGS